MTDAWITLAGLARDTVDGSGSGTLVTPVTFGQIGMFAVTAEHRSIR